jgi:hypothetical protein
MSDETLLKVTWGPVVDRLAALLLAPSPAADELAEAAAALHDVRTSHGSVRALLRTSWHPNPVVRRAVVTGMSVHDVPAVHLRLLGMLQHDPDACVREAAQKAFDTLWEGAPLCMMGCGERATLAPEPSTDPHDPPTKPIFCAEACATEWALEHATEMINGNDRHHCRRTGEWIIGGEDECADCKEDREIGEDEDEEKGTWLPVTAAPPSARKPRRRRARGAR